MSRISTFAAVLFVLVLAASASGQTVAKFAAGKNGMAATGSVYATRAAVRILESGGNAVDASAAACLVLMVTDPANASIGGRAQIILRLRDGRVITIDGATQAPSGLPTRAEDEGLRSGYGNAPIPGALAALEQMVRLYGRLEFADVLKPAIETAESGFRVPERLASSWERNKERLASNQGARLNFLKPDGSPYGEGDLFIQKNLAKLLREIATDGIASFYRGRIAERISADIKKNGGYVRLSDLKAYEAVPGKVVVTNYRGYDVVSAGGRAWGNTLAELLNILENFKIGPGDPDKLEMEILARTIAQAIEDRPQVIGTLDEKEGGFSLEKISTKEFAKERAEKIRRELGKDAKSTEKREPDPDRGDTSHLSVMDGDGNAVSLTTSIGPAFGARVATPDLGFLYAHSYKMRSNPLPNVRDLTEMTPTIVFKGKQAVLAVGAAGSERIPTAVLQVISNYIDRGWSLERSVSAPRMFCNGNELRLREELVGDFESFFRKRGFEIEVVTRDASRHNGLVHAVSFDPGSGTFYGAADEGDSGGAAGPVR